MMTSVSDLTCTLTQLGVEECFHAAISSLCSGEVAYLCDIEQEDLVGFDDANGVAIAAPVARGLVRKLQSRVASEPAVHIDAISAFPDCVDQPSAAGACELSLWRGCGAEASLLRCAINARPSQDGIGVRRKILTLILDRSGSMKSHWSLLVQAVSQVATDDLLADPFVSLCIVVYDGSANEVPLPASSALLHSTLLCDYRPNRGITCFRAAFEAATRSIQRSLDGHVATGTRPQDVDLTTLLFTDGQDTSLPPRGAPSVASTEAARLAGDHFRRAIRSLGCASYVAIAAFGEDHSPELCQYLSDRYTYINRQEVLSDWLASGLDEMLGSGGQCSVTVRPPPGVTLEEPLLFSLPLNADGSLHHHVMLRACGPCAGILQVEVCLAGGLPVCARVACDEARLASEGFEQHLFNLDHAALELRKVARELSGRQPSNAEVERLRTRLVGVREQVRRTKNASVSARGSLRGRAALRIRANEVDTLRDRLSYAIGHFGFGAQDQRKMGSVGIDAVLRDAGQQTTFGEPLAALFASVESFATMPAIEALSSYGKRFTFDAHSGCDAQKVAEEGDALFFQLHTVQTSPDGALLGATDSTALVAQESFLVLSDDGRHAVTVEGMASFTHIGIPLYVSPGHFLRVQNILPGALRRISPAVGKLEVPELILLSLLGRTLATGLEARGAHGAASRLEFVASLLQKVRAVHAVLAATPCMDGKPLLDRVQCEAKAYANQPSSLRCCTDLYSIAAMALFVDSKETVAALAKVVVEESLRRQATAALKGRDVEDRLWLAWALLGPGDYAHDAWVESLPLGSLEGPSSPPWRGGTYNPLTAAAELEGLDREDASTWAPRPAGIEALRALLTYPAPIGSLCLSQCGTVRHILAAWSELLDSEGGLASIWQRLDDAMLWDEAGQVYEAWVGDVASRLGPPDRDVCARAAIDAPLAFVAVIVDACDLGGAVDNPQLATTRFAVAAATRAFVAGRAQLARHHPIDGATPPAIVPYTPARAKEIWGSGAEPIDKALYACARKAILEESQWRPFTVKMALVEKRYREMGGTFAFPGVLDTFIEGLHCRTRDLHKQGQLSRVEAIPEMLLRLRWDDGNAQSRRKLSEIVGRIWDGLDGEKKSAAKEQRKEVGVPLSSALWLIDNDDGDWIAVQPSDGSTI